MFVYLIRAGDSKGPIKIGKAIDVDKRISELQTGCPFTLSLITKIPCDSEKEAFFLEKWLHDRFRRQWIRGEWFTGKISLACLKYAKEAIADDKTYADIAAQIGMKPFQTRDCRHDEAPNQRAIDRSAGKKSNIRHELELR